MKNQGYTDGDKKNVDEMERVKYVSVVILCAVAYSNYVNDD